MHAIHLLWFTLILWCENQCLSRWLHPLPRRWNRVIPQRMYLNQRAPISSRQWARLSLARGGLLQGRITGGRPVSQGEIPYQLALHYKNTFECGATLANVYGLQLAITAAHCVWTGYPSYGSTLDPYYVSLTAGELDLLEYSGLEQMIWAKKIVMHENYDKLQDYNDIALIFLEDKFNLSGVVQEVELPDQGWDEPDFITFSGWGRTKYDSPMLSDYLQSVKVPVLPKEQCREFGFQGESITEKQICTSGPALPGGGLAHCRGDSGGPGISYNDTWKIEYLSAIVSYGFGECGQSGWPDVSTRMSAYMDWVKIKVSNYLNSGLSN